jgi:hypothetical protein
MKIVQSLAGLAALMAANRLTFPLSAVLRNEWPEMRVEPATKTVVGPYMSAPIVLQDASVAAAAISNINQFRILAGVRGTERVGLILMVDVEAGPANPPAPEAAPAPDEVPPAVPQDGDDQPDAAESQAGEPAADQAEQGQDNASGQGQAKAARSRRGGR